jgi:hypothetical protein
MKRLVQFFFGVSVFFIAGCSFVEKEQNVVDSAESTIDTLYSDDVLREYAGDFSEYKSTIKMFYLNNAEQNGGFIEGANNGLRLIYISQKFPQLNENYKINIVPISDSFSFERINRNEFKFTIEEKVEMVVFDVLLSCDNIVFKYADLDKKNNLTYIPKESVRLARFYEPVTSL